MSMKKNVAGHQQVTPAISEILVAHHSHMDVGYTHSQPVFWRLQNEYIGQVLDWLEETAGLPDGARPKWTCETSEPVLRWLSKASSQDAERFVQLHRAGRIGMSALRWHTTPLADRRGLERLLNGKRELETLLDTRIPVACQHDVTGVPWPLGDVLLDAGVDFLVMAINVYLGQAVRPRPGMFLWEAPSGRTLRVFNGNHYTMFDQLLHAWDDSVDRMHEGWQAHAAHLRETGYPLDFVYLTSTCSPVMWDNAPPNPFMPDLIQRWNAAGRGPHVRYATLEDLRERASRVPDAALQRMRGDWTDFWNFGCAGSPISTARNQRAKPIAAAAERLGGDATALATAFDRMDLYDEHTFGYYDSDHRHPQAQTTELLKQALAHEGHEQAAFALMDGLEQLAQNPRADKRIERVLLVNPGSEPLTVFPEIPAAWFDMATPESERTYRASRMFHDGRSWEPQFGGGKVRSFGAVSLPPFSWRVIALDELPAPAVVAEDFSHEFEGDAISRQEINFAPAASHQRRVGRITTPFHVLRYDPDSGRILSLLDRRSGHEVLSPRSGIEFFSFVRERPDALVEDRPYAYYQRDLDKEKFDESCWQDWKPVRESATRYTRCDVVTKPHRIELVREAEAPGMIRFVERIVFSAHDPVIHVEVEMERHADPKPQGIYLVTALALQQGWRAMFDTAGQPVLLDQDQLPGSCRNWVTMESMAAMWDERFGAAIFSPDAPMVQFGDFHFGQPLDAVPRPENPLLLAWPMNNYWDTNYQRLQAGHVALKFGFLTFDTEEVSALQRAAQVFRQPALVWPVTGRGRASGEGTLAASMPTLG